MFYDHAKIIGLRQRPPRDLIRGKILQLGFEGVPRRFTHVHRQFDRVVHTYSSYESDEHLVTEYRRLISCFCYTKHWRYFGQQSALIVAYFLFS